MHKKLFFFAVFLFGFFATFDFAVADIVAPNMTHWGCRNYQMSYINHNKTFHPGDSINFTFSVECPRSTLALSSIPRSSNYAYPTKCSAAFGLGNLVSSAFNYTIGRVGDHTTGVWSLVDVGGGYVRCSGAATYQFPALGATYPFALVYPIFTDYTNRPYPDGLNVGAFGEHIQTINQTCTCSADYYKVNNGTTSACVGAKGVCGSNCKKVTNNCGVHVFAPTKTSSAWNSFIGTHPSCLSLTSCQ